MTPLPPRVRHRRALAAAVASAGLLASSLATLPAVAAPGGAEPTGPGQVNDAAASAFTEGRYIVTLADEPAVTYTGGIKGLAPTAAEGNQFDTEAAAVQKYDRHLRLQQQSVASSQGVEIGTHFTTALNGFVADLTAEQALELSKDPRVLAVEEDVQNAPDYSSTDYLGLPGENGTWNSTYGGVENAGKGVVIGIIDSGYYPEQEFLAGEPVQPLADGASPEVGVPYRDSDGRIAMLKADGGTFKGECQEGQDFSADTCNSKVVAARYFADDFIRLVPPTQIAPHEKISPVDVGGHGTHTATTAAGNAGVEQTIDGETYGTGSGVAPEAKVSVYKICWEDTNPDTGGCYTSASVGAIEAAIQDNVDVLNYSISGNNNSTTDSVARAFRSAAAAGIFVAASGGNSGPTANTVNHSSPWLTTVAASTFSNEMTATAEFADGTKFRGASSTRVAVEDKDVVLAEEVGLEGKSANEARLCHLGALDPAKAEDKIVVCDRGETARVEKSQAVKDAGGVGMVLVNIGGGSEDADVHSVPTVHTSDESIKTKVSTTDLKASIVVGDTTGLPEAPLPQIAGFSSRGPSNAVNNELLKPDISAPGVNVMAGISPHDPGANGNTFGLMSGTSMSAPNVAGLAALLAAQHPDWSPMAVKSAMMTTSTDVKKGDGSVDADNFATGAGHVDPKAMDAPGLVYESTLDEWTRVGSTINPLPARQVNLASVAIPDVGASASVERTVTATEDGTWTLSGDIPGYAVSAAPATLELKKGEKAQVTLTFTRQGAPSEWVHGSFTWTSATGKTVTSPVTLRGLDLVAPSDVTGEGPSGSAPVELMPGISGTLTPAFAGLTQGEKESITKAPGNVSLTEDVSNRVKKVTVPVGTKALVVAVDSQRAGDDWDLRLRTPSSSLITTGATMAMSERIVVPNPEPGEWTTLTQMFATSDRSEATADLGIAVVRDDARNLSVTPDPLVVTAGQDIEATVHWKGLSEGTWYGAVEWRPGVNTLLTVEVGPQPDLVLSPIADATATVGQAIAPISVELNREDADVTVTGLPEGVSYDPATGAIAGTPAESGSFEITVTATVGAETATQTFTLTVEEAVPALAISPIADVAASEGEQIAPIAVEVNRDDAEITVAGLPAGVSFDSSTGVISGAPTAPGTFEVTVTAVLGEESVTETFTLTVEAVVVPEPEPEPVPTCKLPEFSDNPATAPMYDAIRWMQCSEISLGYSDGTFKPRKDVSRGESVAFIYRYVDPEFTAAQAKDFTDVPVNHTFFQPISWAKETKVSTGYTDGSFKPGREVTRGEFASFLYRAVVENRGDQASADSFDDVPAGSAHRVAIEWLQREGLSTGYVDGTFRPTQPITRAEVAALMHRYDLSQED